MKMPRYVCVTGAPLMTTVEAGLLSLLGYMLYVIGCSVVYPAAAIVWTYVPSVPTVVSVPTISLSPQAKELAGHMVLGAAVFSLSIIGVMIFVLWSRYNYERCQSFWTKQVENARPLPMVGILHKKPPKLMCVAGSPLVTVMELSAIGGVIYLLILFFRSLPEPTPREPLTPAEAAYYKHIGDIVGCVLLGLVSTAIFIIWSKWNYTLCRRYWNKNVENSHG